MSPRIATSHIPREKKSPGMKSPRTVVTDLYNLSKRRRKRIPNKKREMGEEVTPPPPPPPIEGEEIGSHSLQEGRKIVLESISSPTTPQTPPPNFISHRQKNARNELLPEFMDEILWRLVHGGIDVLRLNVQKLVEMLIDACDNKIDRLSEILAQLQGQDIETYIVSKHTSTQIDEILTALQKSSTFTLEDTHRGAPTGLDQYEANVRPPTEYYVVTKHSLDANTCTRMEAAFTSGQAAVCSLSIPSENNFVGEAVFSKKQPQDLISDDIADIHHTLHSHKCKLSSLDRDANKSYRFIADFHSRINKLESTLAKLIDHHRRQAQKTPPSTPPLISPPGSRRSTATSPRQIASQKKINTSKDSPPPYIINSAITKAAGEQQDHRVSVDSTLSSEYNDYKLHHISSLSQSSSYDKASLLIVLFAGIIFGSFLAPFLSYHTTGFL